MCVEARFVGAELTYAEFPHADLSCADFTRASLFRTRFHCTREDGVVFTDRTLALGNDEKLAEAEAFVPTV
jgi:uncharacterized protein YjbI with pentapeptide repeats